MLKNLYKVEKALWNEMVSYEGVDKEMAEFVAMDRNDVITAKDLYNAGEYEMLKGHIDYLDTYVREAIVIAFADDLGSDWVRANLGWSV